MFENMSVVHNTIKKEWKIIFKESRKKNRKYVVVCIEKVVIKVENCSFWLVILTNLAGDALIACVVYLEFVCQLFFVIFNIFLTDI